MPFAGPIGIAGLSPRPSASSLVIRRHGCWAAMTKLIAHTGGTFLYYPCGLIYCAYTCHGCYSTFAVPLGEGALIFGMVYNFLPFMIYPIHNTLQKMPRSYIEAAQDLGATPVQAFVRAIIPLFHAGRDGGVHDGVYAYHIDFRHCWTAHDE